jgi:3-oxoacyl-(acyl-carrier-protein) synthase
MEATHNALADAGLTKRDVDAVFTSGRNMANDVPEYLGIRRASSAARRSAAVRSFCTSSTRWRPSTPVCAKSR